MFTVIMRRQMSICKEQSSRIVDMGRKFYLLEETCFCDEKEIELKPIPYIKTWQNAKELLRKKPYSVPEYELSSPERIEKSAKKNGIVFPLLKSNL